MATRAVWRRVPGDPRSTLGWVWRDRQRLILMGLHRAHLALALLALWALAVHRGIVLIPLGLAAFALITLFPGPEPGPEAAEPSPGHAFRGQVEISRGGVWLGEDAVVATFVDGWLHVEGLRTGFALRSEDLAGLAPTNGFHYGAAVFLDGMGRAIVPRPPASWADQALLGRILLRDGTELRFHVRPTLPPSRPGEIFRITFESNLQHWSREASPVGDSILPPDCPHPVTWARACVHFTVSWLSLLAALFVAWFSGIVPATLILLLVTSPSLFRAVRAFDRLRRVLEPPAP